jgi:hypothetical protein
VGVRSRIATGLVRVAKVFGPGVPESFQQGEIASQMTPTSPFTPGQPVSPYDGYDRYPRTHDFVPNYNIATRPRTHERVSFDTLRGLIEAYDVAQIAIWHRIDSIRSVKWKLLASDHYFGDVTDAIHLGAKVLSQPDGVNGFKTWLGRWLYDILAYDAGCLYRRRNRGGAVIGLQTVDGTTIAPLLDYWGNPPAEPAEAYVQYANGLPWNWLTRADLIYEPFRAINNSIYGRAPLESIILNANTDIRFQVHFLQRFTEGNIPEAFASAPETWSPDQIERFQGYWDSFMYGDQARKHQIRWMPGGSSISWTNEKDFTDAFSLFMMRKTAAAYHVVPTDLGFTDNANYSTGESQADVQHRVGDLPLMAHIEDILSRFLYDDLRLPLKFEFDKGEDQDDRLVQAQADQIYINSAVVGVDEIREMRFGLPVAEQKVPRVFFTERAGPIPLNALYAVAGKVDPETGTPTMDAPLPHQVFGEVQGVLANPPLATPPLAEQEFGPSAMPPAPPPQPPAQTAPVAAVGKEAGVPTEGITTDTGIHGYDLIGHDNDDDEPDEQVKKELAAFRAFRKGRRRAGVWRDFDFRTVDADTARELNEAGRRALTKAGGGDPKAGDWVAKADPTTAGQQTQQQPQQQDWPGWAVDVLLAALFAKLISGALGRLFDTTKATQIARQWQQSSRTEEAATWLAAQYPSLVSDIETAVGQQLDNLWPVAWAVGTASAEAATTGQRVDWKPLKDEIHAAGHDNVGFGIGNLNSSYLVYDAESLQDWLTEYGVATIQGIAQSRMDDLAKILEQALADNTPIDAVAAQIQDLGADPQRAQMIAITEINRASNQAALAYYQAHGTTEVLWLLDEDPCPVCIANAEAGPVPIGEPFPSLDFAPPAHPRCRCGLIGAPQ